MRHFVKLHDSGGRDIAWPVDLIERVAEMAPEVLARNSATECVGVFTRETSDEGLSKCEMSYVIGTVDSVLAKIKEAQS